MSTDASCTGLPLLRHESRISCSRRSRTDVAIPRMKAAARLRLFAAKCGTRASPSQLPGGAAGRHAVDHLPRHRIENVDSAA